MYLIVTATKIIMIPTDNIAIITPPNIYQTSLGSSEKKIKIRLEKKSRRNRSDLEKSEKNGCYCFNAKEKVYSCDTVVK